MLTTHTGYIQHSTMLMTTMTTPWSAAHLAMSSKNFIAIAQSLPSLSHALIAAQ